MAKQEPSQRISEFETIETAIEDPEETVLSIDGAQVAAKGDDPGEYARLYAHFSDLLDRGESDVDLRPFCHVVDALSLGRRQLGDPFHENG